ncbi:MAG: DNA-processing protein DprA [Psychrobacter sp.]|nr:DNA-processing protein DprA [Psychrobacter sp.]
MTQTLNTQQRASLTLWYLVNASLSTYSKLLAAFGTAAEAISVSSSDWRALGIHPAHLARLDDSGGTDQVMTTIDSALANSQYRIIFQDSPDYPLQLAQLYDPPPLLFCRGNIARLHEPQIAIVGSRKPSAQAQKITFDMAQYLAQAGYVITSGLAMGVDHQAHLGALTLIDANTANLPTHGGGRTIGVMGTGIDVCYPKNHDGLFERIAREGGCLVSELLPGTPPNKYTFPRRNRIVAGLSLATIVTEAAVKSGSLITARLASEQGKQVFAVPSHIDNTNAEGCHHLIREGATLIYHPEQIIEDVRLQSERSSVSAHLGSGMDSGSSDLQDQPHSKSIDPLTPSAKSLSKTASLAALDKTKIEVSPHLAKIYQRLDWSGQDLDALIKVTGLDTPSLLSQLMELELLGLVTQQGGRYLKV